MPSCHGQAEPAPETGPRGHRRSQPGSQPDSQHQGGRHRSPGRARRSGSKRRPGRRSARPGLPAQPDPAVCASPAGDQRVATEARPAGAQARSDGITAGAGTRSAHADATKAGICRPRTRVRRAPHGRDAASPGQRSGRPSATAADVVTITTPSMRNVLTGCFAQGAARFSAERTVQAFIRLDSTSQAAG